MCTHARTQSSVYKVETLKTEENGHTGRQSTHIIFKKRKEKKINKKRCIHLRPNPVALCVRTATAAVRDIPLDAIILRDYNSQCRRRRNALLRDDDDDEKTETNATVGMYIPALSRIPRRRLRVKRLLL